jgi:glutathione peroxidase-family protein
VYEKYAAHGLEILAFPSNEFGHQEPGTCADIKRFARQHYHTSFPLFDKVRGWEGGRAPGLWAVLAQGGRSQATPAGQEEETLAATQRSPAARPTPTSADHPTPLPSPSPPSPPSPLPHPQVEVNGPHAHPVYQYLRRELPASQGGGDGHGPGKPLPWNFQKVRARPPPGARRRAGPCWCVLLLAGATPRVCLPGLGA